MERSSRESPKRRIRHNGLELYSVDRNFMCHRFFLAVHSSPPPAKLSGSLLPLDSNALCAVTVPSLLFPICSTTDRGLSSRKRAPDLAFRKYRGTPGSACDYPLERALAGRPNSKGFSDAYRIETDRNRQDREPGGAPLRGRARSLRNEPRWLGPSSRRASQAVQASQSRGEGEENLGALLPFGVRDHMGRGVRPRRRTPATG